MSMATLIRRMSEAGAPPEAIAIAVAAIEEAVASAAAEIEGRRASDRTRQQRSRDRHVMSRDTSRDAPPKKEVFPPTPPLLEKTPPLLGLADARPVDEPVDVLVAFEKTKKNTEALKAFGEQWNRLAAAFKFPPIDEIKTGSMRERHALARLREMPADGVNGLMARIRGSPYLRGEVNGFRCTFDWIINASNFQKIMEGNYEVRKAPAGRQGQAARIL